MINNLVRVRSGGKARGNNVVSPPTVTLVLAFLQKKKLKKNSSVRNGRFMGET